MSDWLIAIAGTPQGARLAMVLALVSAVAHAGFGALQKGRHDPWLTRASIDLWIFGLSMPVALFAVPWPKGREWALLVGAMGLHFAYKLAMALAYSRAAYVAVYPVVRGTAPLVTVAVASLVFREPFAPLQWSGLVLLSGSILSLAILNLRTVSVDPAALRVGLGWAFLGGILVAVYTTYDAFGIRATQDPFTFLAWFFFLTSVDFPILMARKFLTMADRPSAGPLLARGLIGALVAFVSFGGVMVATRLDAVGRVAVLRETSIVFAVLIGWLVLREKVGPARAVLMGLVALGAVVVQLAG